MCVFDVSNIMSSWDKEHCKRNRVVGRGRKVREEEGRIKKGRKEQGGKCGRAREGKGREMIGN